MTQSRLRPFRSRRARRGRSAEGPAPARPVARSLGYWPLIWTRLERDRTALVSAGVIVLVLLTCFAGEPVAAHLLGHGPNDIFPMASDISLRPAGPWTRVPDVHHVITVTPKTPRTLFILGADGPLGRDLFLRVLDGGRTSLEIALGAAGLASVLGVAIGLLAGYLGGWVDAVVGRLTEFVMGFPILLFVIALGLTISDRLNRITLGGTFAPGVIALVVTVGTFSWFYPARVVRAQVLTLRNQDFVEAARMVGASDLRIMRKHLFPHVVDSVVVFGTLLIATTIFLEAALSILNVGVELPYASWGNLIAGTYGTLLLDPSRCGECPPQHTLYWMTVWPSVGIFASVLAFNLLGESVRQALDPRGRR